MVSFKTLSKSLLTAGLVFLLLNTSSLGLTQSQNNSRQEPVPHVFGVMGENQWFISAVTISFDYEPAKVKEIFYNLSGVWYDYIDTGPFNVITDGMYSIQWYWVETSGRPHDGIPIQVKIDKTPPTIDLSRKSAGKNKLTFTAVANDDVSKIERVEFYLDGVLTQTFINTPYQYNWSGEEKQIVYAIAYNYAGFLVKSDNMSTTPRAHFRNFVLMQKIFNNLQMLLEMFLKQN